MNGWVILVDQARDFPNADTPHKVITTGDYLARPKLFAGLGRAKIINLSRSYNYQSKGYYASLLAEARGHRVIPTVETMLDLRELKLYEQSLPELQEALTAAATKAQATEDTTFDLLFCFGFAQDPAFRGLRPAAVRLVPLPGDRSHHHARQVLEDRPAARPPARQARAGRDGILPHEPAPAHPARLAQSARPADRPLFAGRPARSAGELPPSSPETLRHFQRIAEKQSVEVELITRRQLAELAEFDGLFIRATTSIDNFTYRFAQRARSEGMPVIDDPQSMIRCTNKVYLHELLEAHGVPVPPTVMLADDDDLIKAERLLGWPMVVKIPDGSFSRGVHKVETAEELKKLSDKLFEDTDLLLAQKFMPTKFDWRVGVLDGEPLFVCQYQMARGHWQIIKHGPNGAREGGSKTLAIATRRRASSRRRLRPRARSVRAFTASTSRKPTARSSSSRSTTTRTSNTGSRT